VRLFLADTSAWHRSGQVADRWSALIEHDELALCEPVALEILYSARGRAEFKQIAEELEGVRMLSLGTGSMTRARRTQAKLAERGQHPGPKPMDLLIAAAAESHGAVLLHYDRHFDAVVRVTGQPAEWLAKRGSLD
jgi:predicted nucleic acid-binding protein